MIQFEQGTLDSLWAAKRALDKAIENYDKLPRGVALVKDDGYLFAALDFADTAKREINDAILVAEME